MPPFCETCRQRLLDRAYGLLDAAEELELDAHLEACAVCRAARDEVARLQGLLARAAKADFPPGAFAAPPASAPSLPVPARQSEPRPGEPERGTVRGLWVRAAVAAALLLSTAATLGPVLREGVADWAFANRAAAAREREARAIAEAQEAKQGVAARVAEAQARAQAAKAKELEVAEAWVAAEAQFAKAEAAKPFKLELSGPASLVPGAPNGYAVRATTQNGAPVTVSVEATLVAPGGARVFKETLADPAKGFVIPAKVWAEPALQAGGEVRLELVATGKDAAGGGRATLTETLPVRRPVYATHLETDKPLYQPGETVYYRSLTLDRGRFLPPSSDAPVRYEILGPDGVALPGSQVEGGTTPFADGAAVAGPDGKPVKGVGTGAFAIPAAAPGGEYVLKAFALPEAGAVVSPGRSTPAATLKFLVNRYVPDAIRKTLEFDAKSYGPGDVVQAKVTAFDQATPIAGATLRAAATAYRAGRPTPLTLDAAPQLTDEAGAAALKFTLPKGEFDSATVEVSVSHAGVTEAITRPVPLASKKLTVEFFPEGGDLVAGAPGRVYFRATTATGKPADVGGVLTDGVATIARVQTLTSPNQPGVNQGLGVFALTPEAGKTYAIVLDRPAGVDAPELRPALGWHGVTVIPAARGYALPAVKPDGISLQVPTGVTKRGEALQVVLHAGGREQKVVVGAYTRGQARAHQRATVTPGRPTALALDLGPAPQGGVTRVTVFAEPAGEEGRADFTPIAERLVFRAPAEGLNLAFAAAGANPGPLTPGEPVSLAVRASDETGKPAAAVLMAAVVNQSAVTMADDKAARLMPTHFLLSGEVQKPEELEHADFLLTDHPEAAPALDLLLGTQGWRRFAEQAPGQFRKNSPDSEAADRLLVASGAGGPVPTAWRAGASTLFNDYWPRYVEAVREAEAAEGDAASAESVRPLRQREQAAVNAAAAERRAAADLDGEARDFRARFSGRRARGVFVAALVALALGALAVLRVRAAPGSDQRRWLNRGLVGFGLLAAVVVVGSLVQDRVEEAAPGSVAYDSVATKATAGARRGATAERAEVVDDVMGDRAAAMPAPAMPPAPPGALRGATLDAPALKGEAAITRMTPDPTASAVPNAAMAKSAPTGLNFTREAAAQRSRVRRPDGEPAMGFRGDVELLQQVPAGPVNPTATRWAATLRELRGKVSDPAALTRLAGAAPRPPLVVREYAHSRGLAEANRGEGRNDFTETLLWKPVLVTSAAGEVSVPFDLSDAVGSYQVIVAGHTLDGRIGSVRGAFEVRKAMSLEWKLPPELGTSDRPAAPLVVTNGTAYAGRASGRATVEGLARPVVLPWNVELAARAGGRAALEFTPELPPGAESGQLTATVRGSTDTGFTDQLTRTTKLVADGFPLAGAQSGTLTGRADVRLPLPKNPVAGSLKAEVTFYPNPLSQVQAGLDGLMREPYGCFEQTSTANYPNVLVLDYLKQTAQASPDQSKRARDLLDKGYARLTGYECPRTQAKAGPSRIGFEWFGAPDRPHLVLSAYGLLQFTDMSRVYPVDAAMLARTRDFLLEKRDGQGGFHPDAGGLDKFGRVPPALRDAYVVWAVTEADKITGTTTDLTAELGAIKAAVNSRNADAKDPYYLALVAKSFANRGDHRTATGLMDALLLKQAPDGSLPGAATSVVSSGGRDLLVETTALAALAWGASDGAAKYEPARGLALRFLASQRGQSGTFGSTQATVLALKALADYARGRKELAAEAHIDLFAGGQPVARHEFAPGGGPVRFELPQATLGGAELAVRIGGTAEGVPYTVSWTARTAKPTAPAGPSPLALKVDLSGTRCAEGATLRLTATVTNLTDAAHGMTVAVVGLPAGLKVPEDFKQLKSLTELPKDGGEPKLAYFELRGRELILYWRGTDPRAAHSVGVDLIAATPGSYVGPASRAYLYYNADQKDWVDPVGVTIDAAP